jgi:hypothetical protein
MSCQSLREAVFDAAAGALSPELEAHLPGCEACRAALAAERALMNRIVTGLEDGLATEPSAAFLPGVRRRIAEVRAQRDAVRRWWPVPALATLAGALVAGLFVGEALRDPTPTASHQPVAPRAMATPEPVEPPSSRSAEAPLPAIPSEPTVAHSARILGPAEGDAPGPGPASEVPRPTIRPEPVIEPARPRVFVPAEDERAVRRLARRLRGHAARAAVLAPEAGGPVDFTPEPVEARPAWVSLDDRALRGDEPGLEEPPSFDRMIEKAGRET